MWVGYMWAVYGPYEGRRRVVAESRFLVIAYALTRLRAFLWDLETSGEQWGINWGLTYDPGRSHGSSPGSSKPQTGYRSH